jgi:nucleotidyltransferase/DNA polymerase involved in DNA repair
MGAVMHLDANYFYAQVEALYRPEIRGTAWRRSGEP